IEHAAVVLAREPLLDELDAVPGGLLVPLVLRGHDREALGRNADVPQDQRQHALADAAKTHEQDPSWKLEMNLVIAAHDAASVLPSRHAGARLCRVSFARRNFRACCLERSFSVSAE